MPLYKSSQILDLEDIADDHDSDEVILYEEEPSEEDVVEMHQPDVIEVSFKLPSLPGSDADMPLEVVDDGKLDVEEKPRGKKDKNDLQSGELEVADPWKDPEPKNALQWVQERLQNLPRHSGRETTGMERTIAVLSRINKAISRIIANDFNGEVDVARLEEARKEIMDGINRLEEAKERLEGGFKRKKADAPSGELVKEGQKATHIGGIIVTVPLIISSIARICINSTVSAGKDIEKTAQQLIEKYKLNDREQLELLQLLADMGYQVKRPRGYGLNDQIDTTSPDNFDWMPNYSA